jgi:endoglycosylceramidase
MLTLLLISLCEAALSDIKVDTATHFFVDALGRYRIFHGVNAVYKVAPFYPSQGAFNPSTSLNKQDIANLVDWGFNVVRLGFEWIAFEPQRGVYNQTYATVMKRIAANLASQGVYVLIDFHQDIGNRYFCGEGEVDLPKYFNVAVITWR